MPFNLLALILVGIVLVLIIGIENPLTLWAARIYLKK
jgi:hypothetical protein